MLESCKKIVKANKANCSYLSKEKRKRNRLETRKTQVFFKDKFKNSLDNKWKKYIKAIITVERKTKIFNTKTKVFDKRSEKSFYASTTKNLSAKEFNDAIRGHWGIENISHCVKDVSMNEDKSRIRINPDIFATLRSFGLNVMRNNNVKNISNAMFRNCLNINRIFKYKELLN